MSRSSPRVFSREFKLQAVGRMLVGENASTLSRELKVLPQNLCVWRDRFRFGGPEALRGRGRPRKGEALASAASGKIAKRSGAPARELKASRRHIAELERKIGQQQLELDFFRRALRQVKEARQPTTDLA